MQFSRILIAALLPLQHAALLPLQHIEHIDTAPFEPYAPPTGDINFGIIAAIVCIALFLMFITMRGKRRK